MITTLALLLAVLSTVVTGFLPAHRGLRTSHHHLFLASNENCKHNSRIIVVGKIILDKYGNPKDRNDGDNDETVTIGGGGPQAAFGACAGLAARDLLTWEGEKWELITVEYKDTSPPKQDVTFLAPIGLKNWTPEMTKSLNSLLPMLQTPPVLIASHEHITPTINIWHDENEIVNWMPVNGSFGEEGADGLWRNRPSAHDILDAIKGYDGKFILHAILEAGNNSPAKGLDALPFFNSTLMDRVSVASIEPIVFPDEAGIVSPEDISQVISLIKRVEASLSAPCKPENDNKLLVISPDRPCYDALFSNSDFEHTSTDVQETEFAVRDGANGSFIKSVASELAMPSATLNTLDGTPVNPTGAGNAYSGAYAACRATGSSAEEAASLANAVGAVVCEFENLPQWRWEVLERVAAAACEVRSNVRI
mmetsp:Transcript_24549/g.52890  ORF Transcript_24549/g.52890 Transcript_24549/m.52890 type:complete len:422 (-) Transcript_24549:808-2073(-)|eukprot:CAMPEP_0172321484 /NCGR_PEP_ID=MMETSP1058-20130122/43527_1 /TAXON_ID=83371 /ORGANISM="Detonula confervacea, Strain CCMP 353" /LENGTH=421 /DNA_ID=CAMNT_0013037003 /DNA_START=58 /DNA_END=1323 /DNA_ORIENTATION=-